MSVKCFIGAKAGVLRVTKLSNGQARPLALTCRAGKIELNTQPRQTTGLSLVPNGEQRLRVLTLVASCVQVNVSHIRALQNLMCLGNPGHASTEPS